MNDEKIFTRNFTHLFLAPIWLCPKRQCTDGNRYAAVNPQSVEILFQAPSWRYEQIGIVTCLGAQAASDASVYRELQRQAAGLGADAVLVISSQPATQGGFAAYNALTGYGFASGPSVIGLKLSGIALKRIKG